MVDVVEITDINEITNWVGDVIATVPGRTTTRMLTNIERVEKKVKHLKAVRKDHWRSAREALGAITEEYHEVIAEIHKNNKSATGAELIDLAAACVYALESMDNKEDFEF